MRCVTSSQWKELRAGTSRGDMKKMYGLAEYLLIFKALSHILSLLTPKALYTWGKHVPEGRLIRAKVIQLLN